MLLPAAASLDRLVTLTAPGAPVAPVIDELDAVNRLVQSALPALEQARVGAALVDQLDRIRNSAGTLRDSLRELVELDGMTTFDPAFAADDPAWDAWFVQSAQLVRDAAALLGGR